MTNAHTQSLKEAVFHAQSLIDNNQFSLAEEQAREILVVAPGNINALRVLGTALRKQQRLSEAQQHLAEVVRQQPKFALAQQELGLCLAQQGEYEVAAQHLEAATNLDASLAAAWQGLANAHGALGNEAASRAALHQQLQHSSQAPELVAAMQDFNARRIAEAEQKVRNYLKQHPTDVSAIRLLAEIAIKLKLYKDAESLLERALELAPDFHLARLNYASALHGRQRPQEALAQIAILEQQDNVNPAYLTLKAAAQAQLGELEEAVLTYNYLIEHYPAQANIVMSLGHTHKAIGAQEEAIAAYLETIKLNPNLGEAYWSLANMKVFKFDDELLAQMHTLASSGALTREDAYHLAFALGKAYEDRKAYNSSFEYYEKGNNIKAVIERYSADANHADSQRTIQVSTPALFAETSLGCQRPDPIFVVGLPRSGSTLIEQILASHSQVDGTKELPDIIAMARRLSGRNKKTDPSNYPEVLAELTPEQRLQLGEEYLERAAAQRGNAPFFIDKMPNNFAHIALIQLILPNAKIIDARRHPMAACFGGYKQLFASGQRFSYRLEDIGRYYQDYEQLMAHFDQVLPGRIHRVCYENMVNDTENEIRKLLDYCNLNFEEACVNFHQTERSVRTASSEQVRQPIYTSAVELWKAYGETLSPLQHLLQETTLNYERLI
ncbi:tetratricopeptide repeat-containing sulfotransferase family protein [Umboniibacter marinipuniceus]|uniref:Tetratricopeptide repeat protein n=1 Tax=Umboniibacter marinipuniceus TaxID=569599 RepID=A0A3M0AAU2_9GAMM|nr:tetratricopeptide repeat-containing sulfotransferase family protein [Umboniibacter marinipuniceus]RMA79515.1 tetratricopeptide repeat protein [Umboniibacter marinipuniceus]